MKLPVYVQQMVFILYLKTSLVSALYGKMVTMSLNCQCQWMAFWKCQWMAFRSASEWLFEIFKYFTANSKKNYGLTNKQGQTVRW